MIIFRILFIHLLCLIGSVVAWDATVQDIIFKGHTVVATSELYGMLEIPVGTILKDENLRARIKKILAHYYTLGYYKSTVEYTSAYNADHTEVSVICMITEGTRFVVGDVVISGNRRFAREDIQNELELITGHLFPVEHFDEAVDRMLIRYGDAGYPYAAIEIAEYGMRDSTIWVVLEVKEGRSAIVKGFKITGNIVTQNKVILREINIKRGDTFNRSAVIRAEKRLKRISFLRQVESIQMEADESGSNVILHITVHEDAMNDINGVIGYIPGEDEKGYVTGRVDILLRNVSGSGRLVHAQWEKLEQHSSSITFRYEEPWVLGYPVTVGGEFEQQNREQEGVFKYVAIHTGIYMRIPLSENITSKLGGVRGEIIPMLDTTFIANPDYQLTYQFDVVLAYDTRDEPVNAATGMYYVTEAGYRFRKGKEDNQTYRLIVQHFIPVFTQQTLVLSADVSYLQTDDEIPPYGELFELGGVNSLRGYRDAQFFGSRTGLVSLEYKYFPEKTASMYLFTDVGYFYRPQEDDVQEEVKLGYGFGGIFLTRLGALKLEYGLGVGDAITEGKIHVRWHKSF